MPKTTQATSSDESGAPEKLVGALVGGLNVLRYLAAAQTPVGVSRIARDLDLNPSTCFNLLKTLVHEGLAVFDDTTKTYSVGLGLLALAKGTLEQASYIAMVKPHLREVAQRHNVTSTLWHVTNGERVVLVDRADNDAAIRVHMNIGQRLPMYVAALGRCIAAHSGLSVAELRSRFGALRWDDGLTFDIYQAEVEEARKRGYAVDHGHYAKGVTTVSTAVLDELKRPLMAISAVGIGAQMTKADIKALGEDLRERGAEISGAMAGRKGSAPIRPLG
ncbi:IclR family transcriptional regulator [Variovorax sp.]|jgi:DNA-binding IclR family transcriptional regulator|uniref:IclR family transcriptional regulator n=1 Tax=Variovorax sp. TaxID=1871043 RepID=UPI000C66B5B1|nr:IclR family transcriptional regulator [Variovorax sp.]MBS77742.1 IclR family transcriptional regulator [Variovorax sp.]